MKKYTVAPQLKKKKAKMKNTASIQMMKNKNKIRKWMNGTAVALKKQ